MRGGRVHSQNGVHAVPAPPGEGWAGIRLGLEEDGQDKGGPLPVGLVPNGWLCLRSGTSRHASHIESIFYNLHFA